MSSERVLSAAAFGDQPGCWPLPEATTGRQRWLRAVAAGAQGQFGVATAELAALRREVRSGPLLSLALSTQGSFARQLGGHVEARGWDGRALATAESDREAATDALIGLAADALGVGRFMAAARLLARAETALAEDALDGRLPVRCRWVAAELAMARGDGAEAVAHAERAIDLADAQPSLRHRVKTQVVYAAALTSAGRVEAARAVAVDALAATDALGLVPLRWAVASLLAGIAADDGRRREAAVIRDASAEAIRHAGGVWRR
jgi:hypothetical protein